MVAASGCRDNGPLTPADLSGTGGGAGTGGGDMAVSTTYMTSTIAAMRQGAPDSYELDNVTVFAKTSSSASPHLVIQDVGGGDFSAMLLTCSATSPSHPCSANSTVKTIAVGESVTVKGLYIKASNASGATETFYIDSITDNGPVTGFTVPVQPVALTDIQRNVQTKKWWFQHVVVTPAPAAGALVMYDMTPSELVFTGSTCPKQVGWGMAPSTTTAGKAATLMCSGTTQPAGSTGPDATEVLIGTDFYRDFNDSSDCACAKPDGGTPDQLVTSSTATMGAIGGMLNYDSVFGSSPV
ncbi:MAG TPA: hypothetical protein VGL86_23715, partial [Polyangia bacterium]